MTRFLTTEYSEYSEYTDLRSEARGVCRGWMVLENAKLMDMGEGYE